MSATTPPRAGRPAGRATVPGAVASPRTTSSAGRARVPVPDSGGYGRPTPGDPGGPGGPGGPGRPGGPGGPGRDRPVYRGRRRPRWGRLAFVAFLALLLLGGAAFGGLLLYAESIDDGLNRRDPFAEITGGRPPKTVDGALNILLLGTDSRDPESKDQAGAARADTMILMHIDANHDKAYLISFPRDLYVHVPQSRTDPSLGNTKAKINASFFWGGMSLAVETVEQYTKVRIDHVALIDFGGFKEVTDAVGGVDMYIEKDITSIHKPFRKFTKGTMHLDGAAALDYCRQRYQFDDGDFARMKHQQEFLKALLDKAASGGTLTNPAKLDAFLKAATKAMIVDKDFSITDLALQFRSIRSSDMTFLVSPHKGSADVDGESVVVEDKEKAGALYAAVARDEVGAWVANNPKKGSKSTD